MRQSKNLLLGVIVISSAFFLAIIIISIAKRQRADIKSVSSIFESTSTGSRPAGGIAGNIFLPGFGAEDSQVVQTYQGVKVTSLSDVARIVETKTVAPVTTTLPATQTATGATSIPEAIQPLLFPAIGDSEISINQSGVATTVDFLQYFSANYKNVVFNNGRFDSALKDKNGVLLFTTDLIDKALADDNFSEVRSSLIIQKDYSSAKIDYLKSIRVTGDAIALDKEAIGAEYLTSDLITKALLVGSGGLSKNEFSKFYSQYNAATGIAHQNLVSQSGALAVGPKNSWFGPTANAVGGPTAMGGPVVVVMPCPCDAGLWVTIGQPVPAFLFVPLAFAASPLFFTAKAIHPGAWWLGLYNPELQTPCASGAACVPMGTGGMILMAGTSA